MQFWLGEASVPFIGCGSEASRQETAGDGGAFMVFNVTVLVGEAMELGAILVKEGWQHMPLLIPQRGGGRRA
jgi:uncharacterized protein (DUF983 family)